MFDQAIGSTVSNPKLAAALAASEGANNKSANPSVGEAFVSLFHQLMNRGVASAGLQAIPFDLPLHTQVAPVEHEVKVEEVKEEVPVEVKQDVESSESQVDSQQHDVDATKEDGSDEPKEKAATNEEAVAQVAQVVDLAKPVQQEVQDSATATTEQQCAAQVLTQSLQKPVHEQKVEVAQQGNAQSALQRKMHVQENAGAQGDVSQQDGQQLPQQAAAGAGKQLGVERVARREIAANAVGNPWQNEGRFDSSLLKPQVGAPIGEAVRAKGVEPVVVAPVVPTIKASEVLSRVAQGLAIKSLSSIGGDRRGDVMGLNAGMAAVEKKATVTKEGAGSGKISSSNQAKIVEQIYKMVETALQGKSGNSLMIKLEPAELGPVAVKVTQRGDQMFARVSAESPEVEEVLRANVGEIAQSLAAAGIKGENVHISIGRFRFDSEQMVPQNFTRHDAGKEGQSQGHEKRADNINSAFVKEESVKDTRSSVDNGWIA